MHIERAAIKHIYGNFELFCVAEFQPHDVKSLEMPRDKIQNHTEVNARRLSPEDNFRRVDIKSFRVVEQEIDCVQHVLNGIRKLF